MTGFDAQWLALREGADFLARDAAVRDAAVQYFAHRDEIRVVDLACGAGSNSRALAPFLGPRQSWRLVDHDAGLLKSARSALKAWADAVEGGEPLVLRKNGRRLTFAFERLDLDADLARALEGADLVTAAAFFDLVSPD
ncbi:MAG TPA: class I SAM-dependent methyltransferase, partial [Methylocystis sp.]